MCSLVLFMALSASVSDPTSVAAVLNSPPCSGPAAYGEKGNRRLGVPEHKMFKTKGSTQRRPCGSALKNGVSG